jgi:hypothetical protein
MVPNAPAFKRAQQRLKRPSVVTDHNQREPQVRARLVQVGVDSLLVASWLRFVVQVLKEGLQPHTPRVVNKPQ